MSYCMNVAFVWLSIKCFSVPWMFESFRGFFDPDKKKLIGGNTGVHPFVLQLDMTSFLDPRRFAKAQLPVSLRAANKLNLSTF